MATNTWAIGLFGLRLTLPRVRDRPPVMIECPLSPAQHYSMARDHMWAADEMLVAGMGMHEKPDA